MPFSCLHFLFACYLVFLVVMSRENYHDTSSHKFLAEIEKNTEDYISMQFEHNNFFNKEHSTLLDAIAKNVNDVSEAVSNLQSQFALT